MDLSSIRKVNLALSGFGAATFAALFLYITLAPQDFDMRTRDFAVSKVKERVDQEIGAVVTSETADKVSEFAGIFSERLESEIETLRAGLEAGIAQFIADVLAAACELDCERRAQAEKAVVAFFEAMIERYDIALERMRNLIVSEYQEIMGELRADLQIFTGSSFVALFFALTLSVFRGKAAAHLLPFSLVLTVSTILAASMYIFDQDWVMTIIFSSYWGRTYPIVLSIIIFFLGDIAANKARITSAVLNAIGSILPGDIHLSPC